MNAGLSYLLRRGPVAKFRYLRRKSKGGKGAAFLILGGLFLLLIVGSQIALAMHVSGEQPTPEAIAKLRVFATGGLFLLTLLNFSMGGGVYFRPCEIDFLFPAPISRRDLLLYHHLRTFGILLLSSSWLFLALGWRHAPIGVFGFLGTFFGFLFLNLTTQATGMLFGALTSGVTLRIRRTTILAVVLLAAAAAWLERDAIREGFSFFELLDRVMASPPLTILTAPCRPFVELFLAESLVSGLAWAGTSVLLLAALFQSVVWLDRRYEEAAIRSSQRMQQRLEKVRASGAYSQAPAKKGPFVLPHFPSLGGAGPILWRQGMEALRSWKGILLGGGLMSAWILFMLGSKESMRQLPQVGEIPIHMRIFWFALLASFLMVQNLIFDFRKDLDRMAYLKSLPISPRAVAVGQTCISAIIFSAIQALLLWIVGLIWFGHFPASFGWTLLACAPFNWLVVAVQNLGFLIAPHRPMPKTGFDPAFMARMIVQSLLRMAALALLAGVAFGVGWIFYHAFDNSWNAALAGGGIAVISSFWILTWMMGRAFEAFDVSKDVPG